MIEADYTELASVAGRVAVTARWLDDFEPCLHQELAAEEIFPAASVIKVGIMACLLEQVGQGAMSLESRVSITAEQQVGGAGVLFELAANRDYSLGELCRLMMVVSDNTASNALARQLGIEAMNRLWACRGYQSQMRRYFMDPVVNGQDNTMSAHGAALMLRDLYNAPALDSPLRKFALGCLRRQQYREKIPLLLPESLVIGHKTGELDGVRHDAAVIEADRPYILVILTAQGSESWKVDQAIARFSLRLYQGLRTGSVKSGA